MLKMIWKLITIARSYQDAIIEMIHMHNEYKWTLRWQCIIQVKVKSKLKRRTRWGYKKTLLHSQLFTHIYIYKVAFNQLSTYTDLQAYKQYKYKMYANSRPRKKHIQASYQHKQIKEYNIQYDRHVMHIKNTNKQTNT